MKSLTLIAAVVFACLLFYRGCSGSRVPITATLLASEINQRARFPMDLGEGLRLDRIEARGNTLVSTVTLLETPPGEVSAEHRRILEAASTSDTCREITSQKQTLVDAGIHITKEYLDNAGGLLLAVTTRPGDCP